MTGRRKTVQAVYCITYYSFIYSSNLRLTVTLFSFAVNLLQTEKKNVIIYVNKLPLQYIV